MRRSLKKYQNGGNDQQAAMMQQLMAYIQQAFQAGASPEELAADLVEKGIPPEGVMQIFVQMGMPQEQAMAAVQAGMQGGGGMQQQGPQEEMMEGPMGQNPEEESMEAPPMQRMGGSAKPYSGTYDAATGSYFARGGSIDSYAYDPYSTMMAMGGTPSLYRAAMGANVGSRPLPQNYTSYNMFKEADNAWNLSQGNVVGGFPVGTPNEVLNNVLNAGPGPGDPVNDTIPQQAFDYKYMSQFHPKPVQKVVTQQVPVTKKPTVQQTVVEEPVVKTPTNTIVNPRDTIIQKPLTGQAYKDSLYAAEAAKFNKRDSIPNNNNNSIPDKDKDKDRGNKDSDCVKKCKEKHGVGTPSCLTCIATCNAGGGDKATTDAWYKTLYHMLKDHPYLASVGAVGFLAWHFRRGLKIRNNMIERTEAELKKINASDGEALLKMAEEYQTPQKILELSARDYRNGYVTANEMSILKRAAKTDKKLAKKIENLKVFEVRDPDLPKEFYQQLHLQDLRADGYTPLDSWIKEINPENIKSIEAYLEKINEQGLEIYDAIERRGYKTAEDVKKLRELQLSVEKVKAYIGDKSTNPDWWNGFVRSLGKTGGLPFRWMGNTGKFIYKRSGLAPKLTPEMRLTELNEMRSIHGWNTLYEYGQVGKDIISTGKNKGKYKNEDFQRIYDGYVESTGKQPKNNTEILDFYNLSLQSNQRNPLVQAIEKTLGVKHRSEPTGKYVRKGRPQKPKTKTETTIAEELTPEVVNQLNEQAEASGNRRKYWENFFARTKNIATGTGRVIKKGAGKIAVGVGYPLSTALIGAGSKYWPQARYFQWKAQGIETNWMLETERRNPGLKEYAESLSKEELLQKSKEFSDQSTYTKTGSLFYNLGKATYNYIKSKTSKGSEANFENVKTIEDLVPKFKKGDWVSEAFNDRAGEDPFYTSAQIVQRLREMIASETDDKEIKRLSKMLDTEVARFKRMGELDKYVSVKSKADWELDFDNVIDPYDLTSGYANPDETPDLHLQNRIEDLELQLEEAVAEGEPGDILRVHDKLNELKAKRTRLSQMKDMAGVDVTKTFGERNPSRYPDWDFARSQNTVNQMGDQYARMMESENPLDVEAGNKYFQDPIAFLKEQADNANKNADYYDQQGDTRQAEYERQQAEIHTENARRHEIVIGNTPTVKPAETSGITLDIPEEVPVVETPVVETPIVVETPVVETPVVPSVGVTAEQVGPPVVEQKPVTTTKKTGRKTTQKKTTTTAKKTTTEEKPLTVEQKIERAKKRIETGNAQVETEKVPTKPAKKVEIKDIDIDRIKTGTGETEVEKGKTRRGRGKGGGKGEIKIPGLMYGGYVPNYEMAYGGGMPQAMYGMGMAKGGQMPQWLAQRRFAAAGNQDKMADYGYQEGGVVEVTPEQLPAMLQKLRAGGYNFEIID